MRPRAELDIKVLSRPGGSASELGQTPPEFSGLRPCGTRTSGLRGTPAAARAGKFPESRANKEGAGGARARPYGRRRTRPGRAGARAREERRARRRAGPAHLPGRRLLPPGARRKPQRSPPSPGRGRGSGRGRVRPLRAELRLLGAGPSRCKVEPRAVGAGLVGAGQAVVYFVTPTCGSSFWGHGSWKGGIQPFWEGVAQGLGGEAHSGSTKPRILVNSCFAGRSWMRGRVRRLDSGSQGPTGSGFWGPDSWRAESAY